MWIRVPWLVHYTTKATVYITVATHLGLVFLSVSGEVHLQLDLLLLLTRPKGNSVRFGWSRKPDDARSGRLDRRPEIQSRLELVQTIERLKQTHRERMIKKSLDKLNTLGL